jgi:hypothetical protein
MEFDEIAFAKGYNAARADIAAGRFVYQWTGHTGHWGHWIATQFSDRFGMRVQGFGICFVTAAKVSFNDGYNSVLTEELGRRYGSGALQSVFIEAKLQPAAALSDAKERWLERNDNDAVT